MSRSAPRPKEARRPTPSWPLRALLVAAIALAWVLVEYGLQVINDRHRGATDVALVVVLGLSAIGTAVVIIRNRRRPYRKLVRAWEDTDPDKG